VDAFIFDQPAFGYERQKKNVDIGQRFYCRFSLGLFSLYGSLAESIIVCRFYCLDKSNNWIGGFGGGGVYNLREYFINKESGCKVTGDEKRQRVFEKLKAITQKQQFWLALGGIIILAGAVNLVELICSAGLPVVFTQILALSNLAKWQYYLYMLLYIFIFMLDDLIVFIVAMVTLKMTGITTKYTRLSHLIGGILMLIIGLLLIFKPEWLMFG
jgi:hypothetical protein